MMDLDQVLANIVSGEMTLDQVAEWIVTAAPLYERPPLPSWSNEAEPEEYDNLIDRYSDWEERSLELGGVFGRYTDQAFKLLAHDSERALRIVKAIHAISRLSSNPQAQIFASYQVGYFLWATDQFFDAVDILAEALVRLRESDPDRPLEISILNVLADALRQDKQLDNALLRSDELLDKSTEYGFRGYAAMALLYKGDVLARKGRDAESLDSLRLAVQLRRSLTDDEVKEQNVSTLEIFLTDLGRTATRFSHFDEAIEALGEVAELHAKSGNLGAKAIAVSDIGHVYAQAGEIERSTRYLLEAADLADHAGAFSQAQYWRAQVMATTEAPADSLTEIEPPEKIIDAGTAYLVNAQAQQLAQSHQYELALSLAHPVLEWAESERDVQLEINVRNILSLCYSKTNQPQQAIEQLQRAIRLSDWSRQHHASMHLRYNLAKLLLKQEKNQRSLEVLLTGIAYSQKILSEIESSEFRQQVIAGSLNLYEMYVLILSHHEYHANHLNILWMTEGVRARNLFSWLVVDHYLQSSTLATDLIDRGRQQMQELRALEVELEVRHFAKQIQSQQIAALKARREEKRKDLDAFLLSAGLPEFDWNSGFSSNSSEDLAKLIDEVLVDDTAIVCLFSMPEGISPVVLSRAKDGSLRTAGKFISWDIKDRLESLSAWTGNTDFREGRGTVSVEERHLTYIGPGSTDPFSKLMDLFDGHLGNYLVDLLEPIQAQTLIVIPHRELALIPYSRLLDRCGSVRRMTLAPSLNVLRLCLERTRATQGPTVLIDDRTKTLTQAGKEIEYVSQVRADNVVAKAESFQNFVESVRSCSLLHIAAHGCFNQENPYLSGFLVSEDDDARDILVQYASVPDLVLSSEPLPGSIRLMTVAECMSDLSLNACRLAVLSTCESGIARLHGGGEMTGLPTALLVAGAKSVIASLWRVNDTATAYLMECFYEIWAGGSGKEESPATALAEARERLRCATSTEIRNRFPNANLPQGERPFSAPVYTDAFQCFGSW